MHGEIQRLNLYCRYIIKKYVLSTLQRRLNSNKIFITAPATTLFNRKQTKYRRHDAKARRENRKKLPKNFTRSRSIYNINEGPFVRGLWIAKDYAKEKDSQCAVKPTTCQFHLQVVMWVLLFSPFFALKMKNSLTMLEGSFSRWNPVA